MKKLLILFVVVIAALYACKDEAAKPTPTTPTTPGGTTKSSAKAITKFSFAALSPAVDATIDEAAKTIKATVPATVDLTRLTPVITVSDKATVIPATGVTQHFSKEVTYVVTAGDGSIALYKVSVMAASIGYSTVNDVIYVGSSDKNLYAVDAKTGVAKWKFLTGGRISTVPLYASGLVYFTSEDNMLYALDGATGSQKWAVKVIDGRNTPVLDNGVLFVAGNYKITAINATTGVLKWESDQEGNGSRLLTPTVANGVVYVSGATCCNYIKNSYFYAFDAQSGQKKWEVPSTDEYGSVCAVSDGMIYLSSRQGGQSNPPAKIIALDLSGAKKWELVTGNNYLLYTPMPVVANGLIYAITDAKLVAIDAKTGVKKWDFSGTYPSSTTPIGFDTNRWPSVTGNVLYVADKYYTYALDAQTGAKKWQYEEKYNKPLSSATVANETVYLSYSDSEVGVIGINAATGAKVWNFKAEATYQPCVVDKSGKVYRGGISGVVH